MILPSLVSAIINGGIPGLEGSRSIVKTLRLTFADYMDLTETSYRLVPRPNVFIDQDKLLPSPASRPTVAVTPVDQGKVWDLDLAGLPYGVYHVVDSRTDAVVKVVPHLFGNVVHDEHWDEFVAVVDSQRFNPGGIEGAFGSSVGDAAYNLEFDKDEDGTIGTADFDEFQANYGTAWKLTPGPVVE